MTIYRNFLRLYVRQHEMNMNLLLFIGGLGMSEILLIALVVLLFFGGKKIPELMKGLGKGVKSFKEGMNEVEKEINRPLENAEEKK